METRTSQIKGKIDEAIREAKKKNNYKGAWDKIVKSNYGVDCNVNDARKAFTKEYGYTPYQYYRSRVYDLILCRIANNEIACPKYAYEEIDGIKSFIRKVERFYAPQKFEEVLNMKKEQMAKNKKVALGDDLIEVLDNCPAIGEYEIEDDNIELTIDRGGLVNMMLSIYPPIVVSEYDKKQIDKLDNINSRCMMLLMAEKLQLSALSNSQKEIKFEMPFDELEVKTEALSTYNYDSPFKRGERYVYSHIFSDNEKWLLKEEIKSRFDIYINKLRLVLPGSKETQNLELYKFFVSGRVITIDEIVEKTQKCKEYVIDQVVNMIVNGFLV